MLSALQRKVWKQIRDQQKDPNRRSRNRRHAVPGARWICLRGRRETGGERRCGRRIWFPEGAGPWPDRQHVQERARISTDRISRGIRRYRPETCRCPSTGTGAGSVPSCRRQSPLSARPGFPGVCAPQPGGPGTLQPVAGADRGNGNRARRFIAHLGRPAVHSACRRAGPTHACCRSWRSQRRFPVAAAGRRTARSGRLSRHAPGTPASGLGRISTRGSPARQPGHASGQWPRPPVAPRPGAGKPLSDSSRIPARKLGRGPAPRHHRTAFRRTGITRAATTAGGAELPCPHRPAACARSA
jgi:hypothetical protein